MGLPKIKETLDPSSLARDTERERERERDRERERERELGIQVVENEKRLQTAKESGFRGFGFGI